MKQLQKPRDCNLPPEWQIPINSGTIHAITLPEQAKIHINGQYINAGDVIGVFFTDEDGDLKCGGYDCYTDTSGVIFPAYGDDAMTPEKEGFVFGETMYFKLYSWTCGRTFEVDNIIYDDDFPSTNQWAPLGFTVIDYMDAWTDFECQITAINRTRVADPFKLKAGWNEFLMPQETINLRHFINNLGANLIIAVPLSGKGVYWPEQQIFSLEEFLPGKTYRIKLHEDAWLENIQ